jgi:glucose-6-phosphate 1-dehydrogenase
MRDGRRLRPWLRMSDNDVSFIFDLDGTLVDSVYQHVMAWQEALQAEQIDISTWRIHRRIGMSGGLATSMLLREVDVLGDRRLFAREDYVEEAWRIVDPVLSAPTVPHTYEPGTWGPAQVASVTPPGGWADPIVTGESR